MDYELFQAAWDPGIIRQRIMVRDEFALCIQHAIRISFEQFQQSPRNQSSLGVPATEVSASRLRQTPCAYAPMNMPPMA